MALLSSFKLCLLDRVALEQAIKLFLLAPATTEIVEGHLASRDITDDRISPVPQPHGVSSRERAEQLNVLVSGWWKLHAASRRAECFDITDLGLNVDYVRQKVSFFKWVG
jgi:hypothetical protein